MKTNDFLIAYVAALDGTFPGVTGIAYNLDFLKKPYENMGKLQGVD